MPKLVTLIDKTTGEKLVRNAVDAREILESDPERYSGKVAKRQEDAPEGPPVIDTATADPKPAKAEKPRKSKTTKGK